MRGCRARSKILSSEVTVEKAPDSDRPGERGAGESVPYLFPLSGSMAFPLAPGAGQRDRTDVSELLYSGRSLSTDRRKETIWASLDDRSCSLVEHRPRHGDGDSNRGSTDARRPPGAKLLAERIVISRQSRSVADETRIYRSGSNHQHHDNASGSAK